MPSHTKSEVKKAQRNLGSSHNTKVVKATKTRKLKTVKIAKVTKQNSVRKKKA